MCSPDVREEKGKKKKQKEGGQAWQGWQSLNLNLEMVISNNQSIEVKKIMYYWTMS